MSFHSTPPHPFSLSSLLAPRRQPSIMSFRIVDYGESESSDMDDALPSILLSTTSGSGHSARRHVADEHDKVQCMFGSLQTTGLADQMQAALMLQYNDRDVC